LKINVIKFCLFTSLFKSQWWSINSWWNSYWYCLLEYSLR